MGAIKTWAPIISGLVLILKQLGYKEMADVIDNSGADAVAAVGLLGGLVLKFWGMYQNRKAAKGVA